MGHIIHLCLNDDILSSIYSWDHHYQAHKFPIQLRLPGKQRVEGVNHAEGHCSDSENRSKIHLTAAELGTESREARGVEDG